MQGSLFQAVAVCELCKREGGEHVAGCIRGPRREPAEATDRSASQRQQILELLRERGSGGVTNAELNEVCFRYGARIFELRKAGHKIKTVGGPKGLFRFVLSPEASGTEWHS
jgi:hypothetical protein